MSDLILLEDYTENFNYQVLSEESKKGEYFIRGVFAKAGIKNKNGRYYPLEVMQKSVKEVQDLIKSNGFVGELDHPPCVGASDFSILCKTGWKEFEEVQNNEEVATLNKNNEIEYQSIQEKIDEPYEGKIYHLKGRNIDIEFTGSHRLYLENRYGEREVVTVKEIFDNRKKYNKYKIIKTGKWIGEEKDKIQLSSEIEVDTKAFMGLVGIFLSEGCVSKNKNFISIYQNEGIKADEIRKLLNELPFDVKEYSRKRPNNIAVEFRITNKELKKFFKEIGNCYTKYIPYELKQLDTPYLEELFEWYLKGDGRIEKLYEGYEYSNRRNVFSVSKRLIEDLHEILIKIGGSGNITEQETTKDYIFANHLIEAENKSTLYQLNISTTKGIYLDDRFLSIEEMNFDGNVYCITVPNGNFYIKHRNKSYWTGNSPKINVEKISHKITALEMAEDGAVIGEMKVLNTDYGKKLRSLIDEQVRLGVSTRGLGKLTPDQGLGESILKVNPGYKLKAIDVVFDPSAGTYPDMVAEDTQHNIILGGTTKFAEVWEDIFGGLN